MKSNIKFPKNFFSTSRPHAQKERKEDSIPFKWSKEVLSGKEKAILVSAKTLEKQK